MKHTTIIKIKLLILFLLIGVTPVFLLETLAINPAMEQAKKKIIERESRILGDVGEGVERFISEERSNVLFLSELPEFHNFAEAVEHGTLDIDAARETLLYVLVNLGISRREYMQVRYVDKTGKEALRVERRGIELIVTPSEGLQEKKDRYYFSSAINLGRAETYMSYLDLNREGDPPQIEVPHRPMLRFVAPVYGDNDTKALGVVIININAAKLIERVCGECFEGPSEEGVMLSFFERDGTYIKHSLDASKEWGAARDLNIGANIYKDYSFLREWDKQGEKGFFRESADEVLIFKKINIQDARNPELFWGLLEVYPKNQLFNFEERLKRLLLLSKLGILLLAIIFANVGVFEETIVAKYTDGGRS